MNQDKSDPARSVGEVLGERVERYRTTAMLTKKELDARTPVRRNRPGLTQDELAARTDAIGHPIGRVAIANIEAAGRPESINKNRTRGANATLMDVLVLAIALDVPPLLLFIPLGDDEDVSLGALRFRTPLMIEWAQGLCEPIPSHGQISSRGVAWDRNAAPLGTFRELRSLQNAAYQAENRLEVSGSDADRADFDGRLRDLNFYLKGMARSGVSTPGLPDGWIARIIELERRQR
jgi:hypothetical protein